MGLMSSLTFVSRTLVQDQISWYSIELHAGTGGSVHDVKQETGRTGVRRKSERRNILNPEVLVELAVSIEETVLW